MVKQSKRDPGTESDAIQGSNRTRGVRFLPVRADRPNPYGVAWSEKIWNAAKHRDERKTKSKYFATEKACKKFAAKLRASKRAGALRTLSRHELEDWLGFKAATEGRPWREIVFGWQAWSRSTTNRVGPSRSINESVETYLTALKTRADNDEVSLDTYRQHKHKARLFSERFGKREVATVRTEDIQSWLEDCKLQSGGTWNNYLKVVSLVFTSAKVRPNPCDDIKRRREGGSEEDRKLPVLNIAKLFHTAMTTERFRICLRRLALETFAGVRFSSACRLEDSDINAEDRGIRHRGSTIKTRGRLYVSPYPDVLFAWLAVAPDDSELNYTDKKGKVNRHRRYLALKSELFHVARIAHPQNCLRHSFPTYHLAKRQEPGKTAYLMCHKNQLKLWNDYKGDATAAEGEAFESLTPARVRQWAESGATLKIPAATPATPAPKEGTDIFPAEVPLSSNGGERAGHRPGTSPVHSDG
jgi:integrase